MAERTPGPGDLSAEAIPDAGRQRRNWLLLRFLLGRGANLGRSAEEFMEAALAFGQALGEGALTYELLTATKSG